MPLDNKSNADCLVLGITSNYKRYQPETSYVDRYFKISLGSEKCNEQEP